jgi:TRAP-type C4-dicarboxylate transport system permease small subunit
VGGGLARAVARLRRGAAVGAGLGTVAMTLLGVADVAGRVLFNSPLLGQVEITRILLVYVAFLGLAEAEFTGGHVRLGVLDPVLTPRALALRDVLIVALAGGVTGALTGAAAVFFWDSWAVGETMMAPITLPSWLAKFGVVVGFGLFTLQLLLELPRRVTSWTRS